MTDVVDPSSGQQDASGRGLTLSRLWVFVAIFLPVVATLESSLSTIDLAYQVRLGKLMLNTHHLVRTDSFTFTALGRPWVDQQWGAQVLFALVYRAGSWAGLALLRATLVGLIFFFVYRACRAAGARPKLAAWLTLASFGVSVGGLALRPQLIAMVLFPLAVWLIFDRERHPTRLWLLPGLAVIWANTHGTFFLAPLLLGLAWLEDRTRRSPRSRWVFQVGVVTTLATLLNPFGLKVWTYALDISRNSVITRLIVEWQPPSIRDFAGVGFFLSVAAVVVILARRDRPLPWPTLITLGVFFFIGLFAIRGIFWWAFIAPAIAAQLLAGRRKLAPSEETQTILNLAIAAAVVVLAFVFLPWWRPTTAVTPKEALLDEAPAGVTTALKRALPEGGRIFSAQVWGSWFEFADPRAPVFVDSRIELFPESVWRDYSHVANGQEGWQATLERWHVNAVVADRDQLKGLIPRIRNDRGWKLVYQDRDGLIFLRAPTHSP